MARTLLVIVAAIAVLFVVFTLFHLIYVAFLILFVGLLAVSMFRIGRFAGRGPRQ